MWFYVVNSCYEIDLLVFVFRFFWLFSNWILCGKHLNKSGVFIAIGIKHLGKPERPHLKSQEDVASLAGSFPGKMPWIIWWIMSLYQHVHIYSRATVYILYTHLSQIYIYIIHRTHIMYLCMYSTICYEMLNMHAHVLDSVTNKQPENIRCTWPCCANWRSRVDLLRHQWCSRGVEGWEMLVSWLPIGFASPEVVAEIAKHK